MESNVWTNNKKITEISKIKKNNFQNKSNTRKESKK